MDRGMTYEHDYCAIFRQQSHNISNQEHQSDYDTIVNAFNVSKANEVLGITSEKFDGKAAIKVHVGYKCCTCEYENTKKYTVERHMGQLHGVGRLSDLRVKYEEKKSKNKEQRKLKKIERFSAEIGLPILLEESQQVKMQLDSKTVELDNLIMEKNGFEQKLHERETKFTRTVNDRSESLSQLEAKNCSLYNKVEELKGQLLVKCNEISDTSRLYRENILKMQLNIQQLNGRLRNEKKNTLNINNTLANVKYQIENNEHTILQLRAENLSKNKKVDLCGREKEMFNLDVHNMRATLKTYEDKIAEIQLDNDLLRRKMVNLKSQTVNKECESKLIEKNLEQEIKRLEGMTKFLNEMLKKDVEDNVKFVIPKGLIKLAKFDSNHIYWIFDTNVLLDNIEHIIAVTLLSAKDKLILPKIVTLELEHIKIKQSKDSHLQFKCRKVVRALNRMALFVNDKLFCTALDTTYMRSSTSENDKQLMVYAKKLSEVAKVCFVTCDKTLCLMTFPERSETFIPASMTCDEYRNFNFTDFAGTSS